MRIQLVSLVLAACVLLSLPSCDAHGGKKHRGGAWVIHDVSDKGPCDSVEGCSFVPPVDFQSHRDARALELEPRAILSVSKEEIDHLDSIDVSYQLENVDPEDRAWIGVFCLDNDDDTLADDDYMDWISIDKAVSGKITLDRLVNMRCAWQFRFILRVAAGKYQPIGVSKLVHYKKGRTEPLQIHLAATTQSDEMQAMWISGSVEKPGVWYGDSPSSLTHFASAEETSYKAEDMCHAPATIIGSRQYRSPGMFYNAVMTGLAPGKKFYYQVGDASANGVKSDVLQAQMAPARGQHDGVDSFFVYGDLGDWNIAATGPAPPMRTATTVDLIKRDMEDETRNYVGIFHDGDISYAFGKTYSWDQFGAIVEPISTQRAYMVGIGNHEYCHISGGERDPSGAPGNGFHPEEGNYGADSHGECGVPYDRRFIMPSNGNRAFWWSTDMGLMHHTIISSEHDFTVGSRMYQWLEADLQKVDRSVTPWVFLHLHRPLYCSEDYKSDYLLSLFIRKHLEPLLAKYHVDVIFSGHYHAFERTCPVYQEKCLTKVDAMGVEHALAPVHFMVGSGGADVDTAPYLNTTWSMSAMQDYGYGRVHVYNKTHALMEFVRNREEQVADSKWIVSDHAWDVNEGDHCDTE